MKNYLYCVALLGIFTMSCQLGDRKAAFDFSNKLSEISLANQDRWSRIGTELRQAEQSHDYAKLTAAITDLESFLDTKTAEVKAMKNVGGSEEFKEAMVQFLKVEKEIVDEHLTPFTNMDAETPEEDFQDAAKDLMQGAESEAPYLAKLQAAQRAFAKKNGFKIDERKE